MFLFYSFIFLVFSFKLKDMKQGSWLLGGGWNNDFWGGELPTASWIDAITPHNPVSSLNFTWRLLWMQIFLSCVHIFLVCRSGCQGWMVTWAWLTL